ncbi:microtubule-associated protein tau isoform X19 [Drosophila pseudoobscura]|uniref:Microtubule-associated protein tau isoform X19 n=1 Tax=Drosophila pseudoobscura pseudoobscura TaxID=46245 RepID=A0A6I8VP62_DROPS|nr:microtubule-associated protein tau isoform X19 [Drosophila pseudoobscura]
MADVMEKSSVLDAQPPSLPVQPKQQLQQEAAPPIQPPAPQQQPPPPPQQQQQQQQQQQKPEPSKQVPATGPERANQEQKEGDNDSGVDESTQEKDRNGPISPSSPVKTPTSTSSKADKSGISRPPSATPSNKSASKSRSASKNRLLLKTPEPEPVKKVPMNKVQVGHAPSPNLKAVRSKIGSLDNATYKPGGGHVKIESKKVEIKAAPRIEAKNDKYMPKGGEKKYWKAPRIQRATTLTSSMSLPAECLVLSVSMPSLNSEPKRPKSAGPKKKPSQAVHQKPFRLY